jgi:virginiamycin B lyase
MLAAARAATEFVVPPGSEAVPTTIGTGPDGNLWVFESARNSIAQVTPTGQVTEFPVSNAKPDNMVAGPDGALWFTDSTNGQIGRITTTGALTLYPLTTGWHPAAITSSVDGNLWFIERNQNSTAWQLERLTTAGVITDIRSLQMSNSITSDLDGNLWIAQGNVIKVSPSGATLGAFSLPNSGLGSPGAVFVTMGPNNHIWVGVL